MNLDQLHNFIIGPEHQRQIALTREGAAALAGEVETLLTEAGVLRPAFEIRTDDKPGEAMFQFARLARMRREDEAAERRMLFGERAS